MDLQGDDPTTTATDGGGEPGAGDGRWLGVLLVTLAHRMSRFVDDRLTTAAARTWMAVVGYLLAVLAGLLLSAIGQVSGALSQMHMPGAVSSDGIGFSLDAGVEEIRQVRASWDAFVAETDLTRLVAAPQELVDRIFWLDMAFVVSYTLLGVLLLLVAQRALGRATGVESGLTAVRVQAVRIALLLSGILALVDTAENIVLRGIYAGGWEWPIELSFAPLLTLVKVALGGWVLLTLLITGGTMLAGSTAMRQAIVAARGVLLVVGAFWVLLSIQIGADQVDDVIRAWSAGAGTLVVLAAGLAALVVIGSTAELTDESVDHPAPEVGESALPLLWTAAATLLVLGGVMWVLGLGWGLVVPGLLALALGLVSLPVNNAMATLIATATKAGTPARAPRPWTPEGTPVRPLPKRDDDAIRNAGRWLARLTGAALTALLIWVVVRAGSFDLLVRAEPAAGPVLVQSAVVVVLIGIGIAVLVLPARFKWARWVWVVATAVALAPLLATLVPPWSVTWPEQLGSVTVLLLGVAAGPGLLALYVVGARRVARKPRRLVPILWFLGLRRFPAVAFVVVWVLVIELVSSPAFHDITVTGAGQDAAGPPATVEQAYAAWLTATEQRGPVRPMVLVGAQGGGIRAAVWTALVMECMFGPGPVAGTGDVCVGGSGPLDRTAAGDAVRDVPLPVFLASSASGSSIGLAAWSARRVDLAAGGAVADGTPGRVDDAFGEDFVAPDLARLLTGDLAHVFLAHDWPDRADVFERALAQPWGAGSGLSRGLLATWQEANGPRQWRIPVLALNGFQVEDGCRLLVSQVDFELSGTPQVAPEGHRDNPSDGGCGTAASLAPDATSVSPDRLPTLRDVLPRTTELVDYLCPGQDVTMATAGHLSARFPYVSPVARVARQPCTERTGLLPDGSVSYVLDGGTFDNSGASTAQEAWRVLSATAAAAESPAAGATTGTCVVPLFLQIDNSDQDEIVGAPRRPSELLAPPAALLREVGSREAIARTSAAIEFGQARSPGGLAVTDGGSAVGSLWFRVALAGQPGPEPPLGWTLAESTIADMRAQLTSNQNRRQIAEMRALLASPRLRCGS